MRCRLRPRSRRLGCERMEDRTLLSTLTVTTTADGGPGSLRQAIIDANAAPGADTITLPAGTYTLTLAGTGEDAAAKGDLDITGDLTIAGAGAATTVIDGGGLDNVFQAIGNITVNISGVTIRNAAGGTGTNPPAGILSDQATLNVTACTFTGNPGVDIRTNSGAVTVADSTFVGVNKKSEGLVGTRNGGGSITATHDTFTGYSIGIVAFGDATITNCTFSDNVDGLSSTGTVTMADTTIRDNSGDGIDGSHILKITRCTISDNAGDGIDGNDTLTITDSTISGNGGDGVDGTHTMTMTRSTISDNGGDGIDGGDTLTLTDSTISGNTGDGIDGNKTMMATGSTISGNGGDGIDGTDNLTMTNSTVSGNTGDGIDGGTTLTLNFVTIADNKGFGLDSDGVTIGNTILASNGTNGFLGTITSRGHNISSDGSLAAALTQPGDLNDTDPKIGPLADNGGPTLTHALLPGSPALDAAGSDGAPATDQRGVPRPQGAGFDIGAFELQVAATAADLAVGVTATPNPVAAGGTLSYAITVADNGPGAAQAVSLTDALPAGTSFVSFTAPPGWTVTAPPAGGTGTVSATIASLAPGTSSAFALVVSVDPAAPGGSSIADTAAVASTTADPNAANNSSNATVMVAGRTTTMLGADLNPATAGQPVTLTAIVAAAVGSAVPAGNVIFTIDGQVQQGPVALAVVGGQAQATLVVAGLAAGAHQVLASYGGTATFAPSASATLPLTVTPAATPPVVDGPRVTRLLRFGYHLAPTSLVLSFDRPLDPARARDVRNYRIVGPRGPIAVKAAVYDPSTRTVTLHPAQRLDPHRHYMLTVDGHSPSGLTDAQGNRLDGDGRGRPGADYAAVVGWDNLVLGVATPKLSATPLSARGRRPVLARA